MVISNEALSPLTESREICKAKNFAWKLKGYSGVMEIKICEKF